MASSLSLGTLKNPGAPAQDTRAGEQRYKRAFEAISMQQSGFRYVNIPGGHMAILAIAWGWMCS
jgi:hypothetical protein